MNAPTWLTIPGSGGFYEASDDGRVRSIPRTVVHGRSGTIRLPGRELSPVPMKSRHLRVTVKLDGLFRPRLVHQLILMTFVGPRPDGLEGCHRNGDPTDNHLENLRWGTRSSNLNDAVRHGTHPQTRKTHCPAGHGLVAPNLAPAKAKLGHRKCYACSLANGQARHLRRKGIVVTKAEERLIADERYARLLDGSVQTWLRALR